ncbi:MAG: hypothetical protein AAF512_17010 [Pseudomonadota bacterium]
MSTINFSVPLEIKEEFNRYFANENKSAVLTALMQQAITEKKKQERRAKAIDAILALRDTAPAVSDEQISAHRQATRK